VFVSSDIGDLIAEIGSDCKQNPFFSAGDGAGLKLSRNYGVIISDCGSGRPCGSRRAFASRYLVSVDGRSADNLPYVASICSLANAGEKIHLKCARAMQHGFHITLKNIRTKWIRFVARGPGKESCATAWDSGGGN